MSEQKHTPGPWRWLEDAEIGSCEQPKLVGANGMEVCNFGDGTQYYPTEGEPPSDADMALISAAPELLAFIQEFVQAWDEGMAGDTALYRAAEKLIAKATGSTA